MVHLIMRIEILEYTSQNIQFTIHDYDNNPLDIGNYDFIGSITEKDSREWVKKLTITSKAGVLEIKWPPMQSGEYTIQVTYTEKNSNKIRSSVFLNVTVMRGLDGIQNPSNRYYGED